MGAQRGLQRRLTTEGSHVPEGVEDRRSATEAQSSERTRVAARTEGDAVHRGIFASELGCGHTPERWWPLGQAWDPPCASP